MSGTSPDGRRVPLLILGLGNVLCGDDGLGAAAVWRIHADYELPAGVEVLDGGTLGLSLLPWLEDAERVILVDAIQADALPGSPVRLTGEDVGPAVALRLSPHQVGVSDLLDAARWRDRLPRELILLGLVPETLGVSVELSPVVRAGLPGLVARVVEEARRLGFDLLPRCEHAASLPDRPLGHALPLGL